MSKVTNYATLPPTLPPKRVVWEPLTVDALLIDPDAPDDREILVIDEGTCFLITINDDTNSFQLPDGFAICKQVGR